MPGRPRKIKVNAQSKNNSQVSKVGRKMICCNCQQTSHNKKSFDKDPVPKPPKVNRELILKPPDYAIYASARGGGIGSRGGKCGRVKGVERGGGKGQRGGGSGQQNVNTNDEAMQEDEILKQLDHKYMEELMLQEEEKREAKHKAQQEVYDEEALRLSLKEHARYEKEDEERLI
ncbi:hypothetical protein Tco_0970679 [Tanacetum coccineum]